MDSLDHIPRSLMQLCYSLCMMLILLYLPIQKFARALEDCAAIGRNQNLHKSGLIAYMSLQNQHNLSWLLEFRILQCLSFFFSCS